MGVRASVRVCVSLCDCVVSVCVDLCIGLSQYGQIGYTACHCRVSSNGRWVRVNEYVRVIDPMSLTQYHSVIVSVTASASRTLKPTWSRPRPERHGTALTPAQPSPAVYSSSQFKQNVFTSIKIIKIIVRALKKVKLILQCSQAIIY